MGKVRWDASIPLPGEFSALGKVRWDASIPLLVASLAIAVSEQEQRDTGAWQKTMLGRRRRLAEDIFSIDIPDWREHDERS